MRPGTIKVYDLTTHFRTAVPDVVTLPQMFQRAGYFAARVGNTFVNPRGIDIDEQPQAPRRTPTHPY